LRGNPTNSATVFPHKAADAGELGHLDPHLSAQGHRCGEPGHLDPHLSAQGHRCGATRPTRPPSFRTRPQTRGNPANSATVFPHKATDSREPGQLGPNLSAQSHRRGGTRASSATVSAHKATDAEEPGQPDPISPHKATDAPDPGHKATDAGNRGQLGHRLNSAPISPHKATDGSLISTIGRG